MGNTLSTPVHQEKIKNIRKPLRALKASADNKENVVGHSCRIKDYKLQSSSDPSREPDIKIPKLVHQPIEPDEDVIVDKDWSSIDEPSKDYWKLLAEQSLNRKKTLEYILRWQENVKNNRIPISVHHKAPADNKETVVRRSSRIKAYKLQSDASREPDLKTQKLVHQPIEPDEDIMIEEDWCGIDEHSTYFWKLSAEETLKQNKTLGCMVRRGQGPTMKCLKKKMFILRRKIYLNSQHKTQVPSGYQSASTSRQSGCQNSKRKRSESYSTNEFVHCGAKMCVFPLDDEIDWVQCDLCDKFFHTECVGLKDHKITDHEPFVCGPCDK